MTSPADRKYTKTHEWVSLDGETATIGVTDFAQSELGDITYLELPEIGDAVTHEQAFGIIESVKAANDIFAPVDGEVVARNEAAVATPETVNSSPYERRGWFGSRSPTRVNSTNSWTQRSTINSRRASRTEIRHGVRLRTNARSRESIR